MTITDADVLERLAEMRGAKMLGFLDERYQKGFRDAIDLLIKWITAEEPAKK
jgi:hypothetical protein